jgi:hypothetical protein
VPTIHPVEHFQTALEIPYCSSSKDMRLELALITGKEQPN